MYYLSITGFKLYHTVNHRATSNKSVLIFPFYYILLA